MSKKQAIRKVAHAKQRQAQTADERRFERMEQARKRRRLQEQEARMWEREELM